MYYACIAGCGKWEITGSFHQVGSGDQTQAFIHCTPLVPQRGSRALLALCPSLDCKVSNDATEPTPASPSPAFFVPALHYARCSVILTNHRTAPQSTILSLSLWLPLITPRNPFLNSPFQRGT